MGGDSGTHGSRDVRRTSGDVDYSSCPRVPYVDAQESGQDRSDRQLALDIRKQVGTDDRPFDEYWARMERHRKAWNR